MTYKLFIDDERYPPQFTMWDRIKAVFYRATARTTQKQFTIARSTEQALAIISAHGMPSFISFDHDLGMSPDGWDDTAMVFLRHLENMLCDEVVAFPEDFDYYVHSQNPVGRDNIIAKMNALLKHFKVHTFN